MCNDHFSEQLKKSLAEKISLKAEIGYFNFFIAPCNSNSKIKIITSLALATALLQKDYGILSETPHFYEKPINDNEMGIDYITDYLLKVAEEFVKQLGTTPIDSYSQFGSIRFYFYFLNKIVNYFVEIANSIPTPKLNLDDFYTSIQQLVPAANQMMA